MVRYPFPRKWFTLSAVNDVGLGWFDVQSSYKCIRKYRGNINQLKHSTRRISVDIIEVIGYTEPKDLRLF